MVALNGCILKEKGRLPVHSPGEKASSDRVGERIPGIGRESIGHSREGPFEEEGVEDNREYDHPKLEVVVAAVRTRDANGPKCYAQDDGHGQQVGGIVGDQPDIDPRFLEDKKDEIGE